MSSGSSRGPADSRLMARSARGDTEAFAELFARKQARVFRIAYQILGDSGAAEDVVQEAFLALWQNAGKFRARFGLEGWLTRIATHKAIDRYRTERRHPDPVGEGGAEEGGGAPAGRLERLEALGSASDASLRARWREVQALWNELADTLPAQQRAAFVLREIEGLDARETAAALECSTSAVRTHLSLARRKLRDLVRERYPELLAGGTRTQAPPRPPARG